MTTEKSINQEKQQKINRTLVLRLVRQEKLVSRAEIAKLSGLQRATITNIVKELIEKICWGKLYWAFRGATRDKIL